MDSKHTTAEIGRTWCLPTRPNPVTVFFEKMGKGGPWAGNSTAD